MKVERIYVGIPTGEKMKGCDEDSIKVVQTIIEEIRYGSVDISYGTFYIKDPITKTFTYNKIVWGIVIGASVYNREVNKNILEDLGYCCPDYLLKQRFIRRYEKYRI